MIKDEKTKNAIIEQIILNNARRQSQYINQVQMVDGVPLFSWVDINATELCTRKCSFCPRKDGYPNQNLHIDTRLVKKIADELKSYDYKGGVIFSGYGESILHNDLQGLMKLFDKKIHIELVTNGDKLSEDLIAGLYMAGLDMTIVSLYDGPHQIDYFKKMFSKVGVKEEHYFLRHRWHDLGEDFSLLLTNRAGMVKGPQETHKQKPCFYSAYFIMIDWNGDAILCPQDWNKRIKSGNIYRESLLEVWKSDNLKKYRKSLCAGDRLFTPCNQCNVLGTLHGYNHAKIWNEIYGAKDETRVIS